MQLTPFGSAELPLGATSRLTDRRHSRVILECSGRAEVATHQGHSALLRVPALADCLLNGPSDCSACQSEKPTKNRCRYAQFKDREPSGLPVNDEAYHEAYDAPEQYACCRTHHCPSDWQRESEGSASTRCHSTPRQQSAERNCRSVLWTSDAA